MNANRERDDGDNEVLDGWTGATPGQWGAPGRLTRDRLGYGPALGPDELAAAEGNPARGVVVGLVVSLVGFWGPLAFAIIAFARR